MGRQTLLKKKGIAGAAIKGDRVFPHQPEICFCILGLHFNDAASARNVALFVTTNEEVLSYSTKLKPPLKVRVASLPSVI